MNAGYAVFTACCTRFDLNSECAEFSLTGVMLLLKFTIAGRRYGLNLWRSGAMGEGSKKCLFWTIPLVAGPDEYCC